MMLLSQETRTILQGKELYVKHVSTKVQCHHRAATRNAAALFIVLYFLTCQTYIRIDQRKTKKPKTVGLR